MIAKLEIARYKVHVRNAHQIAGLPDGGTSSNETPPVIAFMNTWESFEKKGWSTVLSKMRRRSPDVNQKSPVMKEKEPVVARPMIRRISSDSAR
jgi:hypothetical protein